MAGSMRVPNLGYLSNCGFKADRLLQADKTSVQFSTSVVSDSLGPNESQHTRPPCPSPTPRVHSKSRPSSRWCHPAILPSVIPFSSCPHASQHQGLFQWVNSLPEVAKVLEFQHQSFQWTPRTDLLQDGLVGSPCSPRDSQESSPTPQFKKLKGGQFCRQKDGKEKGARQKAFRWMTIHEVCGKYKD